MQQVQSVWIRPIEPSTWGISPASHCFASAHTCQWDRLKDRCSRAGTSIVEVVAKLLLAAVCHYGAVTGTAL